MTNRFDLEEQNPIKSSNQYVKSDVMGVKRNLRGDVVGEEAMVEDEVPRLP